MGNGVEDKILEAGYRRATLDEPQKSGFHFLAARKLQDAPESLYPQGGWAVINWLRKNGVSGDEIRHFGLDENLGNQKPTSRLAFEEAIADRAFDFKRKVSSVNPERTRGDYEMGGTRAFSGPRVPGQGTYFERVIGFPDKLKGGEKFAPGQFENPHWSGIMPKGAWGSWRGSVREVPGWGKMVLGEEGQSDYMQGAVSRLHSGDVRRPRVEGKKFFEMRGERKKYNDVMSDASQKSYNAISPISSDYHITDWLRGMLSPSHRHVEFPLDKWMENIKLVRDKLNEVEIPRSPDYEKSYTERRIRDGLKALDDLVEMRKANEKYFEPGARSRFERTESSFTPESPIDKSYVRILARELIMQAAKEKADSVAISTSATTKRIQNSPGPLTSMISN
jgi:hypothetical protein